jgi:DNA-binding Lrp family transcriptional regulator
MDALDVKIIRAMGIVPYGPMPKGPERMKPSYLARAVGTSVNTVKSRLSAMAATGVLAGHQIVPNLRHLGLAAEAYRLRADREERKDEIVAALRSVEGVLEVHDFIGPHVCADVAFRDEEDRARKLQTLVDISQGDRDPPLFYGREMPPVKNGLAA